MYKNTFGKSMNMNAEIVNGSCPICTENSIFISLCINRYRCTTCGTDLEQKINGVISYIPIRSSGQKVEFKLVDINKENGT